ncbi:MAG: sugar phosphate isomerase/epimerase [Caldilineaceae bacterium]|nr:sugar phosphate isomerase/epimerase [Caldilineaceae bacterium]
MNGQNFGINLGFAAKRWPEPHAWARLVRETLGLTQIQFTFDLLDPWTPEPMRSALAAQVRQAARVWDIEIHSAFVGLASYTYNGLLHPDPAGRRTGLAWWQHAVELAAELGATAVGGPLGGMSEQDANNAERRQRLYAELLDAVHQICQWAAAAGLSEVLVEPTPLTREFPHSVDQARDLLADLQTTAVPVRYVLDIGHALYQPLYGPDAALEPWLQHLAAQIGIFHLQNTDFQSDSHWGWPDSRGHFDVAAFGQTVQRAGLVDRPIFLEVFYPFELADQQVLDNIRQSVEHCRTQLAPQAAPAD